jgi:hypothetical protein
MISCGSFYIRTDCLFIYTVFLGIFLCVSMDTPKYTEPAKKRPIIIITKPLNTRMMNPIRKIRSIHSMHICAIRLIIYLLNFCKLLMINRSQPHIPFSIITKKHILSMCFFTFVLYDFCSLKYRAYT